MADYLPGDLDYKDAPSFFDGDIFYTSFAGNKFKRNTKGKWFKETTVGDWILSVHPPEACLENHQKELNRLNGIRRWL